jgi:translation elongation factor EF-G
MRQPQEFKVSFPPEYAGEVIGELNKLGGEVKHMDTARKDVCTLTIDLDMAFARRFHTWLQDATRRKGTMSPEVWIRGVTT